MEMGILIVIGIVLVLLMVGAAQRRDPSKTGWWWLGALIGGMPRYDDKDKRPPEK